MQELLTKRRLAIFDDAQVIVHHENEKGILHDEDQKHRSGQNLKERTLSGGAERCMKRRQNPHTLNARRVSDNLYERKDYTDPKRLQPGTDQNEQENEKNLAY